MAKFKIQSTGTLDWTVEAETYRLEDNFFHFYSEEDEQLFAVRADNVRTIRSDAADKN